MSLPILDWICSTHCCIYGGVNTAFHPAKYGMSFCSLGVIIPFWQKMSLPFITEALKE
jgi:hypothetical protein